MILQAGWKGLALAGLIAASLPAAAAEPACALPGQKPMLVAKLYFGENIPGRKPLTGREWQSFLAQAITPRFPAGFTVYDAAGGWRNPKTQVTERENSKVLEIAAENTPDFRKNLDQVAADYKKQFRQQSVGVVTTMGCARF
jgi:hypothetical protein